jgi:iron(III) transport system substrate-binding protein
MVLKQAPHPAAAQLLADYMITQQGQATSQRAAGTVRKDVPNAYYVTPRQQNLKDLTPQKVTEFQASWNDMFSSPTGSGADAAPLPVPAKMR